MFAGKEIIDVRVDLSQLGAVPEITLDKFLDVEKATKQKRNAASEIFNNLTLFRRQLRNFLAVVGKPLIGFIL